MFSGCSPDCLDEFLLSLVSKSHAAGGSSAGAPSAVFTPALVRRFLEWWRVWLASCKARRKLAPVWSFETLSLSSSSCFGAWGNVVSSLLLLVGEEWVAVYEVGEGL